MPSVHAVNVASGMRGAAPAMRCSVSICSAGGSVAAEAAQAGPGVLALVRRDDGQVPRDARVQPVEGDRDQPAAADVRQHLGVTVGVGPQEVVDRPGLRGGAVLDDPVLPLRRRPEVGDALDEVEALRDAEVVRRGLAGHRARGHAAVVDRVRLDRAQPDLEGEGQEELEVERDVLTAAQVGVEPDVARRPGGQQLADVVGQHDHDVARAEGATGEGQLGRDAVREVRGSAGVDDVGQVRHGDGVRARGGEQALQVAGGDGVVVVDERHELAARDGHPGVAGAALARAQVAQPAHDKIGKFL
jgi:hypothetical protein